MAHYHNLRAQRPKSGPVGTVTRGTTGVNRLRKCDRWMVHNPDIWRALEAPGIPGLGRQARGVLDDGAPTAIDLGYGASDTTTVEWARHLRRIQPDVRVLGLEIEPSRIFPATDGVEFALGGFELAGHQAHLVRAFNVLRQYDVTEVIAAWEEVASHLTPHGLFVEGTCDELGRRCSWINLDRHGPKSLTLAWDPTDVALPSDVAERLPKILIHRNIPGEPIYDLLSRIDQAWLEQAAWSTYGPYIRWSHTLATLRQDPALQLQELPIQKKARLRDCVLTVPFSTVFPERIEFPG